MLTQSDLRAIGKIIDDKLNPLEAKLTKKISAQGQKTDRGFKSVNRKLNVIIDYFDHQDIDIRKRLDRIELHLGIVPLNS